MARKDEISSTERLLDLIRGKRNVPAPETTAAIRARVSPFTKMSFGKGAILGRKVTIGVDLRDGEIKLAAVRIHSERRRELIQYASIPLAPGVDRASPAFVRALREELAKFCDGYRHFDVWTSIASMDVNARNVRIPKVPAKEIANVVYWTFKKEVPLDDALVVFDYEIVRTVQEKGTQKIEALAYTASKEAVESLRQLFSKAGFPLTGISNVPFGIQNLFRSKWIDNGEDSVCVLFVGRDWSRIDLFAGDTLVLSRDIKTGQQSIVETLQDAMAQQGAEVAALAPATEANSAAQTVLDNFLTEYGSAREADDNIRNHPVFQMIQPALDRVVRQVERTNQHYTLKIGAATVRRMYISGQLAEYPVLVNYIGTQVGLPIGVIDPFPEGEASVPRPETMSVRGAFLPAVGMALSQQYQTPNFIFTYRHKDRQRYQLRFNRLTLCVFLVLMVACGGLLVWQDQRLGIQQRLVGQLQTELDSYVPRVERNLLLQVAAKVHAGEKNLNAYALKHLGMAVIGELARHVPPSIRLTNVVVDSVTERAKPLSAAKRMLLIEGMVTGRRVELEPALTDFVMRLGNSPLFTRPTIKQKLFENHQDKEVLRFSAQIDLA